MKVAYMPGCSLDSTAQEYNMSTLSVCKKLGVELEELYDWNCCGASSAHSLQEDLSILIPARNVMQAQDMGLDLTTPCAACFNRLKRSEVKLKDEGSLPGLSGEFKGETRVKTLIEVIEENFPAEEREQLIVNSLNDLPVVTYYGCLMVRPSEIMEYHRDRENPDSLDKILSSLGADVRPWSYKTECCGGSLSLIQGEHLKTVVGELQEMAREAGARAIVTACPLCQSNLEMRQPGDEKKKLPSFFFTELLGLALGLESDLSTWWKKHLIDPRPLLEESNLY